MKYHHKPYGIYEKYIKRPLDFILAFGAMIVLSPVLGILAILVKIKLGSPVIFTQLRPGIIDSKTDKERIFRLYKFRTMTDEKDLKGNLLPDEARLTKFGKILRATSLDELPELANIVRGDMGICGPRPQLVRDMVFMTEEQRRRHTVRPGLTGLAQVKGRNAISWEDKIELDLKYIQKITFWNDVKIILETAKKFFIRSNTDKSNEETDITLDYGDALLQSGEINQLVYDEKQAYAQILIKNL